MQKDDRRAMIRAYKEMDEIGGIYRYVNTKTGWRSPPQSTPNLKGQKNRLEFAQNMSGGLQADPFIDKELAEQWRQYGGGSISIEVLETLKKQPEQSTKEFREDLAQLLALWCEKGGE